MIDEASTRHLPSRHHPHLVAMHSHHVYGEAQY